MRETRDSLESIHEALPGLVTVASVHEAPPGPPLESPLAELQPPPPVEQLAIELSDIIGRQQLELRRRIESFVHRCRESSRMNGRDATSAARPQTSNAWEESTGGLGMGPAPTAAEDWTRLDVGPEAFDQPGRPQQQPVREQPDTEHSCSAQFPQRFLDMTAPSGKAPQPPRESRFSDVSFGQVIRSRTSRWARSGWTTAFSRFTLHSSVPLWLKASRSGGWRGDLLLLVNHWKYELANSLLIILNALLTAWETEHNSHQIQSGDSSIPPHFVFVMFAFCSIFTIDLALRIIAKGVDFFREKDWKWNVFDVVVVFGACLEVIAYLVNSQNSWLSNASLLRVVRLVRVSRVFRAFRFLVYFRDLRITVAMLCDAIIPLMTFCFIMAAVFMVFGIFFTAGATAHMKANGEDAALLLYYGSLFRTMSTLYMAISGGIDWENAATPLAKLSRLYSVVFYSYMAFSIFAMLNVVSAIFIDNTMQRSKNDRDFVVQTEMEGKRDFMNTMDKLFDELDHDRGGTIGLNELQKHILDPKVNAYFRAIDLNVFKVSKLFELMDRDGSGAIDKKEFRNGCARLRGEAKELDVAILQHEVRQMSKMASRIFDQLHSLGGRIEQRFDEAASKHQT